MTTAHLLTLAKTFAGHAGLKMTTIGAYAVNDGKFFERLESGGSCTIRTADKVVRYFSDNWPADLAWPSDIPRPGTPREAA